MPRPHIDRRAAALLLLCLPGLLGPACAPHQSPSPPQPGTSAPALEPATPLATEVSPQTALLTQPHTRAKAPMSLTLQGQPDGADLLLTATLTVRGRIPGDPVLHVELPPGAELVAGQPDETLPRPLDASVQRTYRVRGAAAGPVTVTAAALGPGAGAHALATYPPTRAPKSRPERPALQPIRPVRVQGVTIDRAIPLAPGVEEGR